MLAVARSSSENRFLLRARDTALFYETKVPFFHDSARLWKATVDAQKFPAETQDSSWDSPRRYVTFEVPYILWENSKQENESEPAQNQDQDGISSARFDQEAVNLAIQDQTSSLYAHLEMKRSMPCNSFMVVPLSRFLRLHAQ